ncbi:hypothetical protein AYI70_g1892 [Smittium culicis]|uniref:Uncharacterized protein n=1 Tax=Smittium culicis TaxID=133412 RepID=A0A1R1YAT0_9FUNG|nr:hypothetical protein AYI70_g1892 [Smittium culicis]
MKAQSTSNRKAILLVANVRKSAVMERVRDELIITSVYMRTSIARERAYHEFPESKTWITDLIKAPMNAHVAGSASIEKSAKKASGMTFKKCIRT